MSDSSIDVGGESFVFGEFGTERVSLFFLRAQGNQIDLWSKTKSLSLIEAAQDLSRRFELSNPGPDVEDVE